MAAAYPSGQNTHVQAFDRNSLIVDFSRNPKDFAVNQYCQIVPVQKTTDLYLNITVEQAGRIINSDLADHAWADSNDRPSGAGENESFEFKQFRCERYLYTSRLGQLSVSNADWDIVEQHARIKAQEAMTARTQLAVTELTNTANYDSTHTADVTAISGNTGKWGASTTARSDIKRSLHYAAELIMQDTLGVVQPEQLMLVINPAAARQLALSQEIIDYMKASYEAGKVVRGEGEWSNAAFGLPEYLYGYKVIVERTYKVTTKKGGTQSRSAVLDVNKPFMCARVGGLEGKHGGPNFSTAANFVYSPNDMELEVYQDQRQRYTDVSVIDNCDPVVVAPATGFLFTNAIS